MSNYKLIPISKNARRGLKYYFVNEKPNEIYSTLVSPGDLCFDIGANVGDNTKRLLDLNAKVIAVEPQPNCVNVIKSRCGNNSNLIIIQKALGDVDCEMEMSINSASVLSSLSSEWLSAVRTSGRSTKYCWPDWFLFYKFNCFDAPFPYLNSGGIIGKAGIIKDLLEEYYKGEDAIDDQRLWTKIYLENKFNNVKTGGL